MKQKWTTALVVAALLAAAFGMYTLFADVYQQKKQIEEIDGAVYSFIVGKVEGNDDLLSGLLTEEAQGIIKPGRHAFPGAAEKMGDRYGIKRFGHLYDEGVMIYEVKFFRPPTQRMDYYNVLVLNTEDGWLIAKNSNVDSVWIEEQKRLVEGDVVHPYGGADGE